MGHGGGRPEDLNFQVLNLENILQDTLGGGSAHRKASTYTGQNKTQNVQA